MDNIIFASDYRDYYKDSFKKLVVFANKFNAKTHLLRVITPSKFENSFVAKQNIEKFIVDTGVEDHTINLYNDKSIEDGVLHFGKEIEADIIAFYSHKKRGLIHLFSNSISGKITNHAIRPIITFKA